MSASEPVDPDVDIVAAPEELAVRHHLVLAVVAVGGAVGALARYQLGLWWPTADLDFDWTTLGVNVLGCLVIGLITAALFEARDTHPLLRPFAVTGVLGGFTTFSAYGSGLRTLFAGGAIATGVCYLVATAVAAVGACALGRWTARRLWNRSEVAR